MIRIEEGPPNEPQQLRFSGFCAVSFPHRSTVHPTYFARTGGHSLDMPLESMS